MSMKNPLTPAGIEPATFRFVAQHINHCATAQSRVLVLNLSMETVKVAIDLPISSVVQTCRFKQNYWQNILII